MKNMLKRLVEDHLEKVRRVDPPYEADAITFVGLLEVTVTFTPDGDSFDVEVTSEQGTLEDIADDLVYDLTFG